MNDMFRSTRLRIGARTAIEIHAFYGTLDLTGTQPPAFPSDVQGRKGNIIT